nr:MAG TPA: hypothetical protein [Caudoviricetes sp.]DAO47512.1 MAG TPA: hypothetical protein [Caudoviricetes sp.]
MKTTRLIGCVCKCREAFSLAVLIGRGLDHKISLVSCVVYTLTRLVIPI